MKKFCDFYLSSEYSFLNQIHIYCYDIYFIRCMYCRTDSIESIFDLTLNCILLIIILFNIF